MAEPHREMVGDGSLEDWDFMCSGGFGLVYKAWHKDLGKDVVVKLPNVDDGSGALYAGLCREADYMEAADQQFVPRVYGMYRGYPPGMGRKERKGIVMELMEGGSLQSFLLNKITDFGLSTVTNSVRLTNGENKGGTVSYTPPEGFGGTYRRVRSYDVYSYGILLWTILTGESPYPGVDQSLVRFHIPRGQRPDLRKIDVQKAAGLEELVELMQRCWDSDPHKRPSFGECVEVTRGVFSRHEEGISAACDLLKPPRPRPPRPPPPAPAPSSRSRRLKQIPPPPLRRPPPSLRRPPPPPPPPAPGSTNRKAFLKYASPLSLDPNTADVNLLLSENNRKVTDTDEDHPYPDHPHRFICWSNVLSRECTSECLYYEVEWRGEGVEVAVCQDDVNRKDEGLSSFGGSPQSWMLYYYDSYKRYWFRHNRIDTEVSGPVPSTGESHRVGVYVDPPAGVLCFYDVSGNTMSLLHTERTTFTRPLHVGLCVYKATAEVCEIW